MFRTPFSTWDPQWSETEHEVFRDFGHAAFLAQMLESALITVLLAMEDAGHIQFKKKNDIESEPFLSKKTLGQLFCELRRAGFDGELEALLKDAVEARNFLMHHFFVWPSSEDYVSGEGRGRMLKELQQLRFRIGRAQVAFSQIREQIVEKVYGISRETLAKLYEDYRREQHDGEQE